VVRVIVWAFGLAAAGVLSVLILVGIAVAVAYPNVPEIGGLADYRPKLPMRIYAADGVLLGEFGEERRNFTPIAQIPKVLKDAVLAAEDARFYEHSGVDYKGIARAALANLRDARSQGGSTITMQVAKNFYLPTEKTYTRKIYELLLTLKIEKLLSKEQILELYMNQIFLGQRAYGFAAASEIYFGKAVKDLDIAEAAMLAGLPVAPSAYNPIVNPKRATVRQQFILGRMLEEGFITQEQYDVARAKTLRYRVQSQMPVHAEHAVETARQLVYAQYGAEAYSRGLDVYLTIRSAEQEVAYRALRRGLLNFEQRQFYRGPEAYVDLPDVPDQVDARIAEALTDHPDNDELRAAVVTGSRAAQGGGRAAKRRDHHRHRQRAQTRRVGPVDQGRAEAADPPRRGGARAAERQGRVVADAGARGGRRVRGHRPATGAIRAHGGRLRLRQVQVQPCHSGLAPAGLELQAFHLLGGAGSGLHAVDRGQRRAAVLRCRRHRQPALGAEELRRQVRRADDAAHGAGQVEEHGVDPRAAVHRHRPSARNGSPAFGFEADKHPAYLTMALGAGSVTPMQMATAYSVFANGGYLTSPMLIAKITDSKGRVLLESAAPPLDESLRTLDARNAFVMNTLLQEVTRSGTAASAKRALAPGHLRQDRHHQRLDGRLVRRLPPQRWSQWCGSATTRRASWANAKPAAGSRCRCGSSTWPMR
jgi:penicillin-binding protein 1A